MAQLQDLRHHVMYQYIAPSHSHVTWAFVEFTVNTGILCPFFSLQSVLTGSFTNLWWVKCIPFPQNILSQINESFTIIQSNPHSNLRTVQQNMPLHDPFIFIVEPGVSVLPLSFLRLLAYMMKLLGLPYVKLPWWYWWLEKQSIIVYVISHWICGGAWEKASGPRWVMRFMVIQAVDMFVYMLPVSHWSQLLWMIVWLLQLSL